MIRGAYMGAPFGRVWDTRGPGASFEPEPPSLCVIRARGAAAIDDPRTYHGGYGRSARALLAPFSLPGRGARGPELNRREAA